MKFVLIVIFSALLGACTTGKLYSTDPRGKVKLACDVEFIGAPTVDKFAVEYALSLCAKSLVKKGHTISPDKYYLLHLNTVIPLPPCGKKWEHELAKYHFKQGLLSEKEYGYIVANIDLGLAVVNQCSPNNRIKTLAGSLGR